MVGGNSLKARGCLGYFSDNVFTIHAFSPRNKLWLNFTEVHHSTPLHHQRQDSVNLTSWFQCAALTHKHFGNTLGGCYGSKLSESHSDLAANPDFSFFSPLRVDKFWQQSTLTNSSPQLHISGCTLGLSGHKQRLGCSMGQVRDQADLKQQNKVAHRI